VAVESAATERREECRICDYWIRPRAWRRCRWEKRGQGHRPSRSSRYASTSRNRAEDHWTGPSTTRYVALDKSNRRCKQV